jgi:hypothetical protein
MTPPMPDTPDPPEPQQGVMIDGQFVEARMMSAELVEERTRHQLAALDAAEDDATKRRCLEGLIQTVRIYGQPAIDTIAGRGLTPERLAELLASLPPSG